LGRANVCFGGNPRGRRNDPIPRAVLDVDKITHACTPGGATLTTLLPILLLLPLAVAVIALALTGATALLPSKVILIVLLLTVLVLIPVIIIALLHKRHDLFRGKAHNASVNFKLQLVIP